MYGWEDGGVIIEALKRAKGINDVYDKAHIILELQRKEDDPFVSREAVDELAGRYDADADDFVEGSRW